MSLIATDYDECNITDHGCQQKCENAPGSFYCACRVGYQLNVDNKTCSGKKERTELYVRIQRNR